MISALQFLPAAPSEAAGAVGWLAAGCGLVGGALWLAGSRFSRQLVALVAVAGGAGLGLRMPRWVGLDGAAWAAAVVGALGLGLLGYLFHRAFVRIALAALLATWAIVIAAVVYAPDARYELPSRSESATLWDDAPRLWDAVPLELRLRAPVAAGIGLVVAVLLGALLPRLAAGLFYSLVGFCILAAGALTAASQLRPDLLERIPRDGSTQLAIMGLAVGLGAVFQWWLAPRPRRAAKPGNDSLASKKGDGAPAITGP